MKRWYVVFAVSLAALSLSMVGCGDVSEYSSSIRYQVRTDPLVLDDKLGDETFEPDRPGVMPVLAMNDLLDARNPIFVTVLKLQRENEKANQLPDPRESLARLQEQNKLRDPTLLPEAAKKLIRRYLDSVFGTPAQPRVLGVSDEVSKTLKIDGQTLAKGSSYYRMHCVHCHGVTGNGRGPTAKWVNPHPRDYRQGLFKFQSTDQADGKNDRTPSRDDLLRVLRAGIEGTAMPSFVILPDEELEALVSYVIHLSMRGQVEFRTIDKSFAFDSKTKSLKLKVEDLKEMLQENLDWAADKWLQSQSKRIKIGPNPAPPHNVEKHKASVLRGQQLFLAKGRDDEEKKAAQKANCVNCHTDYGRRAKFRYDSWGTLVRPNNLLQGIYRGGRRPVDIYYRIHSGINGSNMNIHGGLLSSADIWDLVNFVQVLPYPAMRQRYELNID